MIVAYRHRGRHALCKFAISKATTATPKFARAGFIAANKFSKLDFCKRTSVISSVAVHLTTVTDSRQALRSAKGTGVVVDHKCLPAKPKVCTCTAGIRRISLRADRHLNPVTSAAPRGPDFPCQVQTCDQRQRERPRVRKDRYSESSGE